MTALLATTQLVSDLATLIDNARERLALAANSQLTLLYWHMGRRLHSDLLHEERAAYGKQIVSTVSAQLTASHGRGFGKRNLHRMIRFSTLFPREEIVSTLSAQLGWSHFCEVLQVEDPLARDFYAEMCRVERWSVRTLRDKVGGMLFERTALSQKPETLIKQELEALRQEDRMSPALVFRDPYFLDFLGLQDTYSERDLESAILRELESFIMELGSDFGFVARQKRITIDGDDFYIDLLFYHRGLRRLIAVELKLDGFKPAHKGQIELYLRWLDKHERREGEGSPLGLILCAGKKQEMIELLELEAAGVHVAEYLTTLPPRELLEAKLAAAIERARQGQALAAKSDVEGGH